MTKILFIYLFISSSCFSADQRPDYKIDWKYTAGEYLIYDCERRYYACVSKVSNELCIEERKIALNEHASVYPCAALTKLEDKKACVLKSYQIVDLNAIKRFCYPK